MPLSSTEKINDILQKEDRSSTTETEQVLNPEINEDRSTKSRVTTGNRAEDGQATKLEDPFPFESEFIYGMLSIAWLEGYKLYILLEHSETISCWKIICFQYRAVNAERESIICNLKERIKKKKKEPIILQCEQLLKWIWF